MKFQLVSLRRDRIQRDWTQQELAEFYRVESVLSAAGIPVELERGLSDEGDPWFVFCRPNSGDVVIHFARFEGVYIAASGAFGPVLRGRDFRELVDAFIARQPLLVPSTSKSNTVVLHPSALLSALVATALLLSDHHDANAAPLKNHSDDGGEWMDEKGGRLGDLVNILIEPLQPHEQREALLTIGAIIAGMAAVTFEAARETPSIGQSFEAALNETVRNFEDQTAEERRIDLGPIASNKPHAHDEASSGASGVSVDNEPDQKSFIIDLTDSSQHKLADVLMPSNSDVESGFDRTKTSNEFADANIFVPIVIGRNAPLRDGAATKTVQSELQDNSKQPLEHLSLPSADAAAPQIQNHEHGDAALQDSIATVLAKFAGGTPAIHPLIIDFASVPELTQIDFAKLSNAQSVDLSSVSNASSNQSSLDFTGHSSALKTNGFSGTSDETLTATEEKAIAAISFFAKNNPDFKIAQMGRDMILFDFEARPDHKISFDVHSWALPDGSKITIIGTIPDQFLA